MLDLLIKSHRKSPTHSSAGFSLLEVAVVMFIVSLMLGGLLMTLGTSQELNRRGGAEEMLSDVVEALYGFAQATGRLPCPATSTSNGLESPVGGSVAAVGGKGGGKGGGGKGGGKGAPAISCDQPHGFIPSATLGLSGSLNDDGLLMDDWLSPFRYSVTTANADAFTTAGGMRNATMAVLAPDLRVCDAAACGTVIADSLPVVLMSLGADWADFDGADVDETENSGEVVINGYRHGNDGNFVSAGYIEDTYDDLVIWISSSILYTRMITAGQLP